MDQKIKVSPSMFLQKKFRPAVITWNRLEGRPRREDFDRSLRAEVRDALWMLCRQWQFGEFRGEDAGSALLAKVQLDTTRLNRYAAKTDPAVAYDDTVPLETQVECEPIPRDLRTRIQMGRHWLAILKQQGLQAHYGLYIQEYAFKEPADDEQRAQLESDARAHQLFRAVQHRIADGEQLMNAVAGGQHDQFVDDSSMTGDEKTRARLAAVEYQTWFTRLYHAPQAEEVTAWAPSYLEYQFNCAASIDSATEEQVVLAAEQYHHGNLDWYAFDIDPQNRLKDAQGATTPASHYRSENPVTFIPNAIEFSGMPNRRWWEFEDRKTDLGSLRAGTTDLPLLMLAEFGLIYGNDWSVLPYDLEVGSLSDVRGIVMTDVFGIRTFIRPTTETINTDPRHWCMYNLSKNDQNSQPDTRIFLAPAIAKLQEGRPIERVLLARDEMANMVWGVEDIVPGTIGSGTRGYEAANDLQRFFARDQSGEPPPDDITTEAKIRYKLGTTVPENWIPFIAVRQPGSNREIRLQRAAMPRLGTADLVTPRGKLLRHGLDQVAPKPYFIHEEEIPKAGAVVSRSYQRTRWWDGRIYTWLGRRKRVGRGEASSSLEFDQIHVKNTSSN
ncbi:MAG: hypothetical protein NPIRA05_01050 [Nitrospirales bacterium]|nr:MAG: hypothetical protein NPIRA05_01050 [Nitrospirales bacterium]GJL83989.1 MAG: hypothetical protein DHS20C01_36230 [marine bacterium B5-7]